MGVENHAKKIPLRASHAWNPHKKVRVFNVNGAVNQSQHYLLCLQGKREIAYLFGQLLILELDMDLPRKVELMCSKLKIPKINEKICKPHNPEKQLFRTSKRKLVRIKYININCIPPSSGPKGSLSYKVQKAGALSLSLSVLTLGDGPVRGA
ncbi:hypothetical protein AVEN_112857-1 [Araneus ventricosus]|uniref:Uncharacterized protein n=1 Tax=Araneus ventricosus TaxID=182803 RepID=A0A4Y2HU62_ARAVE|nr:hypothetical protein AVEN_112857-1 [Araneus ventricosus]